MERPDGLVAGGTFLSYAAQAFNGIPFVLDPCIKEGEAVMVRGQIPRYTDLGFVLARVAPTSTLHLSRSVYESLTTYLFVSEVFPSWLSYYEEKGVKL